VRALSQSHLQNATVESCSKAPKPGVRPIAIGDAFRLVIDKGMQSFSSPHA
jgi:hypothetical protein